MHCAIMRKPEWRRPKRSNGTRGDRPKKKEVILDLFSNANRSKSMLDVGSAHDVHDRRRRGARPMRMLRAGHWRKSRKRAKALRREEVLQLPRLRGAGR